jgi:hypothetical protein
MQIKRKYQRYTLRFNTRFKTPISFKTKKNSRFEKIRKYLLTNKENTIRDNEIEESDLLFVFFFFTALYLSPSTSLSLSLSSSSSLSSTKQQVFFSFPFSRLTFSLSLLFSERDLFFICRTWAGSITSQHQQLLDSVEQKIYRLNEI